MQKDANTRFDGDVDRFEKRDSTTTIHDATNGQPAGSQNLAVLGEDDDEISSAEMTGNDELEPSMDEEDDEEAVIPLPDETFNRTPRRGTDE